MEQLEQLKRKKRASLQLDLLNEELRQHSSEILTQLDGYTTPQAESLDKLTSQIVRYSTGNLYSTYCCISLMHVEPPLQCGIENQVIISDIHVLYL